MKLHGLIDIALRTRRWYRQGLGWFIFRFLGSWQRYDQFICGSFIGNSYIMEGGTIYNKQSWKIAMLIKSFYELCNYCALISHLSFHARREPKRGQSPPSASSATLELTRASTMQTNYSIITCKPVLVGTKLHMQLLKINCNASPYALCRYCNGLCTMPWRGKVPGQRLHITDEQAAQIHSAMYSALGCVLGSPNTMILDSSVIWNKVLCWEFLGNCKPANF